MVKGKGKPSGLKVVEGQDWYKICSKQELSWIYNMEGLVKSQLELPRSNLRLVSI
jgi:hypothetical protein